MSKIWKCAVALFLCVVMVWPVAACNSAPSAVTLNILAAASLTDAITEINSLYVKSHSNVTIVPNFASSGTLEQQIEGGAPCDVYLSAAAAQMDKLEAKDLLLAGTRRDLLNNKVVLVVPVGSTLNLTSFSDLSQDKVKKVSIGDPASVPAGTYAKEAFDLLGIYDSLQSRLVLGASVRQVLAYVETGDVDAGVVFSTDALISDKVKVVANAPDEVNSKIVYPAAVIKSSQNAEAAKDYMEFLSGAEARAAFEKYGFSLVSG